VTLPGRDKPLIGIVGVCASGKTSLYARLNDLGFKCRHIAQEHSYVPTMWKQLTNPDILVYLETSYLSTISRRNLNWTEEEYNEQIRRLQNARDNADIVIETDQFTVEEVASYAISQLKQYIILH